MQNPTREDIWYRITIKLTHFKWPFIWQAMASKQIKKKKPGTAQFLEPIMWLGSNNSKIDIATASMKYIWPYSIAQDISADICTKVNLREKKFTVSLFSPFWSTKNNSNFVLRLHLTCTLPFLYQNAGVNP